MSIDHRLNLIIIQVNMLLDGYFMFKHLKQNNRIVYLMKG